MLFGFFDGKLVNIFLSVIVLVFALCVHNLVNINIAFGEYIVYYVQEILFVIAWLIAGFNVLKKCMENIRSKNFFDENFLMTIATLGALCIGEYIEAVSVMILYCIGEYLQDKAVDKSIKSISELTDIRAEYANVERGGKLFKVKPEDIIPGEIIVIKAGEKVPIDGIVVAGNSSLNLSALTGESIPKDVKVDDYILSGSININGLLKLKADKYYFDSTVYKIVNLIKEAKCKKTNTENFITQFAKIYTPIVLILALAVIIFPIMSDLHNFSNIKRYISYALMFLVISCPCALIISVPLTFFSGIGIASKSGILIKGEKYLETLANTNIAIFDKTGTLTKANYKVSEIYLAEGVTRENMAEAVLKVEFASNHPIALAIKNEFKEEQSKYLRLGYNITEIPGRGMWLIQDGTEIFVGNQELMNEYNIPVSNYEQASGVKIYAAKNKKYLGCIILEDEIKESARIIISKLNEIGIKTLMLTGDTEENALNTAAKVGITEYYYGLLPEDKVKKMEILKQNNASDKKILYAGDGINDAAILSASDTGIAMGAIGSDIAIEAADIVIADDDLTKIYQAINIAKKTLNTARQNIYFAIGAKIIFLLFIIFGAMKMWIAILADTGVTLLTVINSLKIFYDKIEKVEIL